jgi:hypothetical protein
VERQRAGPYVANVQSILGHDQLAIGVNDRDGARHKGQVVRDGGAV